MWISVCWQRGNNLYTRAKKVCLSLSNICLKNWNRNNQNMSTAKNALWFQVHLFSNCISVELALTKGAFLPLESTVCETVPRLWKELAWSSSQTIVLLKLLVKWRWVKYFSHSPFDGIRFRSWEWHSVFYMVPSRPNNSQRSVCVDGWMDWQMDLYIQQNLDSKQTNKQETNRQEWKHFWGRATKQRRKLVTNAVAFSDLSKDLRK